MWKRHGGLLAVLALSVWLIGCQGPVDVDSPPLHPADRAAGTPADAWAQAGQLRLLARTDAGGKLTTLRADELDLLGLARRRGEQPTALLNELLADATRHLREHGHQRLILNFDVDRAAATLVLAGRLPIDVVPVSDAPMQGRIVVASY